MSRYYNWFSMPKKNLKPPDRSYYDWLDKNPLYVWRNKKGWTLAQFAARVGVSMSAAARWEDSTSLPDRGRIIELEGITRIEGLKEKLLEHRTRIPL